MPANKYALLRYRIIDKCIRNKYKPYPTKENLRQACEDFLYNSFRERVSTSTIDKDLYAMRNEEGLGYLAPIAHSRIHKGYYYTDPNYSIDQLPLNEEDIDAVRFAALTLSQFKQTALFEQFNSAIDKLLDRMELDHTLSDTAVDQYVLFEQTPNTRGAEHLSTILPAIINKQLIQISYQGFQTQEAQLRTIEPYLLKQYEGRWYLISYEPQKESFKTFGLDRINTITPTDDQFNDTRSFSVDHFFKYAIGISTGNYTPEKVRIWFSKFAASYLKTKPLHHSQIVLEEDEKGITIECCIYLTPEFTRLLLAWGSHVRIISPQHFKESVKAELKKTIENYA